DASVMDDTGQPAGAIRLNVAINGTQQKSQYPVTELDGSAQVCVEGITDGTDTVTFSAAGVDVQHVINWSVYTGSDNVAPVILSEPVIEWAAGETFTYAINALDVNGDSLAYRIDNPEDGMSIDANGVVTWLVPEFAISFPSNRLPSSEYYLYSVESFYDSVDVTVAVSDGIVETMQSFKIKNPMVRNRAPVFSENSPNTVAMVGVPYTYSLNALELLGSASDSIINFEWDGDIHEVDIIEGPAGAIAQPGGLGAAYVYRTADLRWTPTEIGTFNFEIQGRDPWGETATQNWSVAVEENIAPEVLLDDLTFTFAAGKPVVVRLPIANPKPSYWPDTMDNPDRLSGYGSSYYGPWHGSYVVQNGVDVMSFRFAYGNNLGTNMVGSHDITVTVSDNSNNVPVTFTLVVTDAAHPSFVSTPDPVERGEATIEFQYQLEATDPANLPLTFELVDGPQGMSIDSNGLLTWTPTVDDVRYHQIFLRVSNTQGGYDQQDFYIDVQSFTNQGPVVDP
ncbi:MAG: hypothetical protein MI867_29675, partial [Pseudomonadales bacterium]|nr:hypothetical protein [Pseudomonadales bacterium]